MQIEIGAKTEHDIPLLGVVIDKDPFLYDLVREGFSERETIYNLSWKDEKEPAK